MVEVVDMTLDSNIQQLVSLRREEERLMEEIVNIPKVALGQQSGYVGAKTQAGTIAQSNLGTAYLYQGFIQFIEKHLAFALNQYKVTLIDEPETTIPVVGRKGKEYLKVTKEFQMEELGVYIKVKDFIDDSARERLISIAQAAMQNQVIDFLEYIQIEKCQTYTELENQLEYTLNKKKRDAEKQQAMMQMMQQAQQEQQMAQQQQVAGMKEQGANYRKELDVQGKMATTMVDKSTANGEEMPADLMQQIMGGGQEQQPPMQ